MSDQVMHCMTSSLKRELLPKCWRKTEREKRKESVCQKRGKWGCPASWWKDQKISQLCWIKACQLNALCSSDVALAVCGHMGCEKGWEPPGKRTPCDGSHFTQSWEDSGKALEGDQHWLRSLSLLLQKGCPVDYRPVLFTLDSSPLTHVGQTSVGNSWSGLVNPATQL